jgi:hypothetical protein
VYRTCLYCMGNLGRNEVLEFFQVGRLVAFDAAKGRLWAVCTRCARWNLAPLEERWEAVEEAERCFRDTRLRVHSENIGLAQMRDGSRLIRIGSPLPGEMAAWRYGRVLRRRLGKYVAASALGVARLGAVVTGATVLTSVGMASVAFLLSGTVGFAVSGIQVYAGMEFGRQQRAALMSEPLYRLPGPRVPLRKPRVVRRWHLLGAWVGEDENGDPALFVPDLDLQDLQEQEMRGGRGEEATVIGGRAGALVLSRGLVWINRRGAGPWALEWAEHHIEEAGSPELLLRKMARENRCFIKAPGWNPVLPHEALALEMALNDEQERRAMEGELATLEAAWRQAEEIAEIADALPDDPLETLKPERA